VIVVEHGDGCSELNSKNFALFIDHHRSWFPANFKGKRHNVSSNPGSSNGNTGVEQIDLSTARASIKRDAKALEDYFHELCKKQDFPAPEKFRLASQEALMGLKFLFPCSTTPSLEALMTKFPQADNKISKCMPSFQRCVSAVMFQRFFSAAKLADNSQHARALHSLRMKLHTYYNGCLSVLANMSSYNPIKLMVRSSTIDCLYDYFGSSTFPMLFELGPMTDLIEHILFLLNVLGQCFTGNKLSAMEKKISEKLNANIQEKQWFERFKKTWTDGSAGQPTDSSNSSLPDRTLVERISDSAQHTRARILTGNERLTIYRIPIDVNGNSRSSYNDLGQEAEPATTTDLPLEAQQPANAPVATSRTSYGISPIVGQPALKRRRKK